MFGNSKSADPCGHGGSTPSQHQIINNLRHHQPPSAEIGPSFRTSRSDFPICEFSLGDSRTVQVEPAAEFSPWKVIPESGMPRCPRTAVFAVAWAFFISCTFDWHSS